MGPRLKVDSQDVGWSSTGRGSPLSSLIGRIQLFMDYWTKYLGREQSGWRRYLELCRKKEAVIESSWDLEWHKNRFINRELGRRPSLQVQVYGPLRT
ncbi:uncharacterized protein LOC144244655 [Crocuta crocuta]